MQVLLKDKSLTEFLPMSGPLLLKLVDLLSDPGDSLGEKSKSMLSSPDFGSTFLGAEGGFCTAGFLAGFGSSSSSERRPARGSSSSNSTGMRKQV